MLLFLGTVNDLFLAIGISFLLPIVLIFLAVFNVFFTTAEDAFLYPCLTNNLAIVGVAALTILLPIKNNNGNAIM